MSPPDALPPGWFWASPEAAADLWAELQRELAPHHPLKDRALRVAAHRAGATDDVLCAAGDQPDEYVVVHLTRSGREELDARHPASEYQGDLRGLWRYEAGFAR